MPDTTTITFDGAILSPEQEKKIVEPIQRLLKGLQATAGKPSARKQGGGEGVHPVDDEKFKGKKFGKTRKAGAQASRFVGEKLGAAGISRTALTSTMFEDTPAANLISDLLGGGISATGKGIAGAGKFLWGRSRLGFLL